MANGSDTIRRVKRILVAGILVALAVSCEGDGGGLTSTPPSSGSASPAPLPEVAVFARGCHETREGTFDLAVSFDLQDRAAVGGDTGKLEYSATVTAPAAWGVGGSPVVVDRVGSQIKHIVVPLGEPLPTTMTFTVTVTTISGASVEAFSSLDVPVAPCQAA